MESDVETGSINENQFISRRKSVHLGDLSSGEESDVELSDQLSETENELEHYVAGAGGNNDNYGRSSYVKTVTYIHD